MPEAKPAGAGRSIIFNLKDFIVPVIFLAGIFIGWKVKSAAIPPNVTPPNVSVRAGGYAFTNPLLDCQQSEGLFTELTPFKSKVTSLISQQQKEKYIDDAAVYFQDLNNGPWFGINERATFSPASLLKLPVMMAYYKMAETDPGLLDKKLTNSYDPTDPALVQQIPPSQTLEPGKTYSVKDLIYRMIVYSDNASHYLLTDNVDVTEMKNIFSDFSIAMPTNPDQDILVNVKAYANFFRILFNASYLTRDSSEQALKLLSETEFKDGLAAGVPKNVAVAHKFGERELPGNSSPNQLHDCGIIYYPNHPYLLCVMTQGQDLKKLATAIRQISQLVYIEVDHQDGQ